MAEQELIEPVCPDCGGPGVTWEDGYVLCDACARKRAIAAKNAGR